MGHVEIQFNLDTDSCPKAASHSQPLPTQSERLFAYSSGSMQPCSAAHRAEFDVRFWEQTAEQDAVVLNSSAHRAQTSGLTNAP